MASSRLAAFTLLTAMAAGANAATSQPNIVVIMFDDLSPRIGAFGDKVAHTPNLDAFATEAVRYPNSFSTAPVCAPSRAAIFSGRYQQTIGAQHMRTSGAAGLPGGGPIEYLAVPPPEVKFFPELLRRAGYYTINVGKMDYQVGTPFTMWDVNAMQADWRKRPADKPFFAFINLHLTHESYLWPEETNSSNPLVKLVTARNKAELAGKPRLTDPASVRVPAYLPDTPVVRADLARLYDNVAFDDRNVGRIMKALKDDGVLNNTIVIVTGDHGDGMPRMKRAVYDAGIRVPFMVRFPDGRDAGREKSDLVSFVDLAPTILSLAKVTVPSWMQGQIVFGKEARHPRKLAFAGADRFDEVLEWQRSVSDGRYQYIRNHRSDVAFMRPLAFRDVLPTMQEMWRLLKSDGLAPAVSQYFARPRPAEELYDLKADPDTVSNLAGDARYARTLQRLRKAIEALTRKVGDGSERPEAEMVAAMWSGLKQPGTAPPVMTRAHDRIALASTTPGASIGYRFGDAAAWQLYTTSIAVMPGTTIEAKAIRYGYAESTTVRFVMP